MTRWEIREGDVLDRLREMPDDSVHCACGCGETVKGRYQRPGGQGWRTQRFVSPAHSLRVNRQSCDWNGRVHTSETKAKISAARFLGDAATKRTGRGRAEKLIAAGQCIVCKRPGERHHIDGNTLNNAGENVVLLCRKHHRTIHPGNGPQPLRPLAELFGKEVPPTSGAG